MPIRPDFQQLEKCIDDALRKNDFKPLKTLVQIDACEDVKIKCSKQFFHKLDDLMCRELNKKDIQTVSTILVTIGRCAKNISILGQAGLPTMIKQGLVQKMVSWLEKSKEIILSQENTKDEAVTNMIEDLLDLLMVIHDVSDEGEKQVVETFVPHLCALVIDSRVNICVQQETLKKMNAILDRMPQLARNILSNQEMLILMSSMGERILDVGDYDLQVGIVEALCRMTTEKQRQELACQWFSMDFIANAFKRIKDYEFETDCRIFLNFINGMLGDKRRVFTFPCLSAFLDKHELKIPSDEKLEEFWIDFNLGSQTLSFYIAGDNDDHQWEAVTVSEEKVQLYSIEVRESKKLLIIILKNIIKISKREGKELILYFDASLEITNVTQKIFGTDKYREFTRKQGISVAKTSVHILFDASGSQILVPESQVSPVEELVSFKEKCSSPKEFAKSLKYINSNQGDRKNRQLEITTPSKRKMSEASMIVPGADRYTVRSPILLINTPPPRRGRIKPPLQMMSSAEKPGVSETLENGVDKAASLKSKPSEGRNRGYNTDKHFKTAVVVEKTENKEVEFPDKNFNELQDVVPDSQAEEKRDKPVLPGVLDNICGNKMHSKLACWTPVTNIELCNNRRASTSSGETFNQDVVINKKLTKQKPSSSISDDNSEETRKRENSKGKGFTDATDTLISKINKRYKPEDDVKSTRILKEALIDSGFSNKPDVQLSTEKVQKKSYRKLKTTFVNVTSECPSNDVYNFNLSGAEEPIIKLGIQEFEATTREACVDNSIKLIGLRSHDELEPSLRTKDKKIITDHKKNLFSDNEAEHRCDDNKTDISWLREPKSKPQLIDYSRNKNVKKHTSGKLRSSLEKRQPRSKMTSDKSITKKVDKTVPDERTKLPRRAAKTKKNYKDLSNSESESEQEFSHSVKKKLLVKEENIHSKTKTISLPKKKWKVLGNTQKELPKEWKNSSLLKDTTRDNCLDLSPLSGTPSSIEVMRCVEKITEGDFSQDYCATRSISPYPKISSSESLSSNSGVGHPIKSPQNNDNNLLHASGSCSPTSQPLFLPRHTPTKNNSVVKRKNINSVVLAQETQNCNSYSDISSHSLEKRFLEIESPNFSENHIQRKREGSRSASLLSMCNEDKENTWFDMPYNTTHVSGLTHHLSRKRMYIEDNLNNSDEVEIEEKEERRAKFVFPKKYKSEDTDHHVHKTSESISPLSNNEFSIHGENWDGEFSGAGMICEKFNSEFRKRIHIRHNIMDQFTKQSCKTAKQHLNSVKHQVKNVRFKRLDKFQFTMTEQLDSFEKESQSLNDFQQEFVDCWERTFYMMKACQKSELQRLHLLKAALDKHVFYDTDCEETIFTSEMCLMKENMKILQDKLLKDMQEEELLNVRRGLMSLFITHERNDNM
ncbi:synaptonemal complex protein 2 isoform X3 [Otolemur garnettii]|uniref:synaptonemal complex protein 2 isoform X3 n=1 Tax=Otolemur garnettii TaxID=30611 RepID=UPI000C7EFA59|nr:synaptonemal complex protein 2 isoform X3 [Otolemur garnettii]